MTTVLAEREKDIQEIQAELFDIQEASIWVRPDVIESKKKALSSTQHKLTHHHKIMDRGWEPYSIPQNMVLGSLWEIPITNAMVHVLTVLFALAVFSFPIVFAIMTANARHLLLWIPCVIVGIPLTAGFNVILQRLLYREAKDESPQSVQRETHRSFNTDTTKTVIRFYGGGVPADVKHKYDRDKHMFDEVYVGSFDQSLFYEEVNIRQRVLGDPFLIGIYDGQAYLGAQWDLSKELEVKEKEQYHNFPQHLDN